MIPLKNYYCYVYECFACTKACAPLACSAFRGQKGASDSLELELQMVVSLHVGVENQTWELWISSQ